MKLVVISTPDLRGGEDKQINALFEAGLTCLHLRKPDIPREELIKLLRKIDPAFHQRISVHQHHMLSEYFGIGGLHFPEHQRREWTPECIKKQIHSGLRLTTSIHHRQEIPSLPELFDYIFYGPLFDSISKVGYKAMEQEDRNLAASITVAVYGIGGITTQNINQLPSWGYSGAALLGSIWKEPTQSVQHFLEFKKQLNF